MGKRPCCSKVGLNKGAWTKAEDKILLDYIKVHGEGSWSTLPNLAGLNRCGKGCRLRWVNYLKPDLKRGNISEDEEDLIVRTHNLIGNRWSLIARRLPGRMDNEIKNYWNTTSKKKLELTHSKMSHKLTKEKSPKQALEPKNIVEPSHSEPLLEPIRTADFRITSKTREEMTPTYFKYSSGDDEESNDSNREMMVNCQSIVDGAVTQEASDLMVDSCEDPQMNDKSIGTSYSSPMLDEHGLEDWFNCSSPINLNELITSDFEHNLGVLHFWSLVTL